MAAGVVQAAVAGVAAAEAAAATEVPVALRTCEAAMSPWGPAPLITRVTPCSSSTQRM